MGDLGDLGDQSRKIADIPLILLNPNPPSVKGALGNFRGSLSGSQNTPIAQITQGD